MLHWIWTILIGFVAGLIAKAIKTDIMQSARNSPHQAVRAAATASAKIEPVREFDDVGRRP